VQPPNSGPPVPPGDAPPSAGPDGTSGEFHLLDRVRRRFEAAGPGRPVPGPGERWIGDDAAVVAVGPGPLLLATDLVVEGVHVDLAWCSPADVGWKSVMVTVSDLAAMGGSPTHLLCSVAGPPGTPVVAVGEGQALAAEATGCVVVGGDLSAAPVLTVSVTALGRVGDGPPALRRDGARPGDTLVVTGPLGASAAGLRLLRTHGAHGTDGADGTDGVPPGDADLVGAHRRPRARLAEGDLARRAGASAAIDVSDGLAADAVHLAEASGVGLDLVDVPVAPGATPAEAVAGGEEYELLVATPDPDGLLRAFAAAGLRRPLEVGRCTEEAGTWHLHGQPLRPLGWQHPF
jgi:thiamine-monophosphate kinase